MPESALRIVRRVRATRRARRGRSIALSIFRRRIANAPGHRRRPPRQGYVKQQGGQGGQDQGRTYRVRPPERFRRRKFGTPCRRPSASIRFKPYDHGNQCRTDRRERLYCRFWRMAGHNRGPRGGAGAHSENPGRAEAHLYTLIPTVTWITIRGLAGSAQGFGTRAGAVHSADARTWAPAGKRPTGGSSRT
jgi:hypothetical protein